MKRALRITGLAVLSAVLTACVALPPPSEALAATTRLGPPLEQFMVRGRAMLRQGERVDHFRFAWQHSPDQDDLLLSSPLGQGVARVTRDAAGARLRQASGEEILASDLNALSERLFGTAVPIASLADWLRGGQPDPHGDVGGWQVITEQTDTVVAPSTQLTHTLPRIQVIRREDITLRWVIDEREALP